MTPLPVLTCDGCGLCCEEMGTPPGFALFFPRTGAVPEFATDSPDHGHLMSAPPAVRADLAAYYAAVAAGAAADRSGDGAPCLWYDADRKACRHYDHRPQVCRDFRVGSVGCRRWRAGGGLGPPPGADEGDDDDFASDEPVAEGSPAVSESEPPAPPSPTGCVSPAVPVPVIVPWAQGCEKMVPPGPAEDNARRHRQFDRLDLFWPVTTVGFWIAALVADICGPAERRLALACVAVAVTGVVTDCILRGIWTRHPWRILSHYYRSWFEPTDSRRFTRLVLRGHRRAVASVAASVPAVWLAVLGAVTGTGALVRGHEWSAVGAGCFSLLVVPLAVMAARGLPWLPRVAEKTED